MHLTRKLAGTEAYILPQFYHTCMLLLFRPVVPISLQFVDKHGVPRPHDVCTQAADGMSVLFMRT